MHSVELPIHQRQSLYHRLVPSAGAANPTTPGSLHRKESHAHSLGRDAASLSQAPLSQPSSSRGPPSPVQPRRVSYAAAPSMPPPVHFTPVMESVDQAVKNTTLQPMHLPEAMTTDDFTRAVAVATVSALRHQQAHAAQSPGRARVSGAENESASGGQGGHDAPSWSRTTSASVLLACTLLYAIIAGLYPSFSSVGFTDNIGSFRNSCRCRRRHSTRLWDRREVPWCHPICTCPEHYRIHERHVICSQWQHCPQVGDFYSAMLQHAYQCPVWKSAQRMLSKSVSYKYRQWLRSPLIGPLIKWAKLQRLSRAYRTTFPHTRQY